MTSDGSILVLTSRDDVTADAVIDELSARGEYVIRLDTADFPTRAQINVRLSQSGWVGQYGASRSVDLDTVKSVWWRRPNEFRTPQEWSGAAKALALSEARAGVLGVLGSLDARWINHPAADSAANYKPVQLATAASVGLDVPQSLITSDPKQARKFVEQTSAQTGGACGAVVYKGLGGGVLGPSGKQQLLPVTLVRSDDIDDGVCGTAHLFQERVSKRYEVRVTVIGRKVFPVVIHAGSDKARLDWRADYHSLRYEVIPASELPEKVLEGAYALMDSLNLYFGAFDFAVTPDGRWVFFEVNPNGQWHWLAVRAGVRIVEAMADALQCNDLDSGKQATHE
jgi:ATP-grasp ribosomal peptide maturase